MTRLRELPPKVNDTAVAKLLRGLIPVRDLPEILPLGRNGTKMAMSTVWRWRRKGRRGRKLPVITIRGVGYVRAEDLVAFLAPDAQEQPRPGDEPTARSKGQDDSRHEKVEDDLAQEFGV